MYHMYFRLFDIHVKIKSNSALGLQCLILINKPFIHSFIHYSSDFLPILLVLYLNNYLTLQPKTST